MKKLIIGIMICLMCVATAEAKVWLIVDTDTDEIISMSPEDDAVLSQPSYEKVILDGDLDVYPLSYHPTYYKYKNKKFIVNIQKLSDKENKKIKKEKKIDEMDLIRDKMIFDAMTALELAGHTFDEVEKPVIPDA